MTPEPLSINIMSPPTSIRSFLLISPRCCSNVKGSRVSFDGWTGRWEDGEGFVIEEHNKCHQVWKWCGSSVIGIVESKVSVGFRTENGESFQIIQGVETLITLE